MARARHDGDLFPDPGRSGGSRLFRWMPARAWLRGRQQSPCIRCPPITGSISPPRCSSRCWRSTSSARRLASQYIVSQALGAFDPAAVGDPLQRGAALRDMQNLSPASYHGEPSDSCTRPRPPIVGFEPGLLGPERARRARRHRRHRLGLGRDRRPTSAPATQFERFSNTCCSPAPASPS